MNAFPLYMEKDQELVVDIYGPAYEEDPYSFWIQNSGRKSCTCVLIEITSAFVKSLENKHLDLTPLTTIR